MELLEVKTTISKTNKQTNPTTPTKEKLQKRTTQQVKSEMWGWDEERGKRGATDI